MSKTPQCPCCERPWGVTPHAPGDVWTPDQIALMQKLSGRVKREIIASIWGVSGDAITAALRADRKYTRAIELRRRRTNNPLALLQQAEAALPAKKRQAKRTCLRCGKPFDSLWIGNRLCAHCGGAGAKTAKPDDEARP